MESCTERCLSRACPGMVRFSICVVDGVIEETTWLTQFQDSLDGRELACQGMSFSLKGSLDKWRFNLRKVYTLTNEN